MKRIAFFLAMILMLSVVALVPVSAECDKDGMILNGTAKVDGELDEAYLNSTKVTIVNDECNYKWGDASAMQPFDGAYCYLLWDADYLYVYAVNKDSTPFTYEDTVETKIEEKIWTDDGPELKFSDVEKTAEFKLAIYPDGTKFTGDGEATFDAADVKHVGKKTADGWVVEAAIPYPTLKAGHQFGFRYQVNNILDQFGVSGSASACGHMVMTLAETKAAPDTGDALVAVLALAAVAGTALVVSKKR